MALNSTHPSYAARFADWEMMRHAYEGEKCVKEQGTKYLPATPGQILDGMKSLLEPGWLAYQAYKTRAVFPDYVSDAVERLIGLLHQKPPEIELPTAMEPLLEKATIDGEGLCDLLRRINEAQLTTGRIGLLADFPTNPDPTNPLPYIAMYSAEACINWDGSDDHQGVNALDLVVLDESGEVRMPNFEWKRVERYRVLQLGYLMNPAETTGAEEEIELSHSEQPNDPTEGVGDKVYLAGVFELANGGGTIDPSLMTTPLYRGKPLDQIPFVFINSKDIVPSPDNPPLIGLGRLCMSIYRGEADYRQALFMQGQDTLVVKGGLAPGMALDGAEAPLRVGAGARIDVDPNGDAKYIGVSSTGLPEMRTSLENDRKLADSKSGTLVSPAAGKQESGDAMTTRLTAQTASLQQVAMAGAKGLENMLKIIATWMGQDPEKVSVRPNTEFTPVQLTGLEVTQYMAARSMGAPLSLKSLHNVFVDKGLTTMTYEDELAQIAEEDADRAKLVASLPQPPAPPAPAPAPGPTPAPGPAPKGG